MEPEDAGRLPWRRATPRSDAMTTEPRTRSRRLLPTLADPGEAERAMRRLDRLDPTAQPLWGRMGALGMLRHLNDAFATIDGSRPPPPAPAQRGNALRRQATRLVALYLPAPWPRGLRTLPVIDQEAGGSPPGTFADEAAELTTYVARYAAGDVPAVRVHPFLGQLSTWEWQRWAYLHVDHHFRQFRV
jgi:hypothetical protein